MIVSLLTHNIYDNLTIFLNNWNKQSNRFTVLHFFIERRINTIDVVVKRLQQNLPVFDSIFVLQTLLNIIQFICRDILEHQPIVYKREPECLSSESTRIINFRCAYVFYRNICNIKDKHRFCIDVLVVIFSYDMSLFQCYLVNHSCKSLTCC